jgi:CDP-diacylglycerol--glycerol-3-phosphate 3-phosphatidyltransferase
VPIEEGSNQNVLLVPIIQAGQFGIKEEEWVFQELFSRLKRFPDADRPILDLTSGYFSLYKPYQDLILNTPKVDCRIVAASPKAGYFCSFVK